MKEGKAWAGTTYGSGWMHRHLIQLLRWVDVRILYVFAYLFVVPVCLILNESRRTAYHYFHKLLGVNSLRSIWLTYINHCRFAEVVIDKFAMYAGRRFQVEIEGSEAFNALAAGDEGSVLLSSHIGNYEIAGYSLVSERKTINAVVYAGEKASVMSNRSRMFDKTNIRMILIRRDMGHLFEIDAALASGEIVSFPTDRIHGSAKVIAHSFLGRTAVFPQGPFSVATMRGLNVLAINVMKEGWTRYRLFVTPLNYNRTAPRKQQIAQLSDAYVKELELRLRQYPTQWYNFFDFWK